MLLHDRIVLFLSVLGALFARALGSTPAAQLYSTWKFPHGVLDTYDLVWTNYTLFGTASLHCLCAAVALAAGHKMFMYEKQVCSTAAMPWTPGYSGTNQFRYHYHRAVAKPGAGECYAPYKFVTGAGCIYYSKTPLMKHDDAQDFCHKLAGRLFIAASTAHYMALRAHLKALNVAALVGISRVNGVFFWDDKKPVAAAEWGFQEPSNDGPWAQVQAGILDFYLNDIPDVAVSYVCQPTV